MKRAVAYPIGAVVVLAITAVANYVVYQAGVTWFVQTPSFAVVVRNTLMVGVLLAVGWGIVPSVRRHNPTASTLLLIGATLFGLGLAVQFRLGVEQPRQLTNYEISAIRDSVRQMDPNIPLDTLRERVTHVLRTQNSALRQEFEAARQDVRLARSLEKAYGATDLTKKILETRRSATTDNIIYRLLPVLIAVLAILLAVRSTMVTHLSARWRSVGFYGSIAICVFTALYMKFIGGVRGANFSPQELLKLSLPVAWAGFLIYYRSAFVAATRERFSQSPVTLWILILALLGSPLIVFVVMRDFGQFLVIGIAQVLLLAYFTRSALYVLLFTAALLVSGTLILSGGALTSETLWTIGGVILGCAIALGIIERFRFKNVMWPSASGILVAFTGIVLMAVQVPYVQRMLATPRARFTLWSDLFSRNGLSSWWDNSRQTIEALYAFDAGGLLGMKLGQGTPFLIPKASSDFVFAAIGEELGFAGEAAVILLFASLTILGLRAAKDIGKDTFAGIMVAGLTLLLATQAFVHIAGTLNLLPMTGITLPFVSSGMSSIVVSWAMLGTIIGQACREKPRTETIVIKT